MAGPALRQDLERLDPAPLAEREADPADVTLRDARRRRVQLLVQPRDAARVDQEARGERAHAQKLYTLYAKDPEAYGHEPSAMIEEQDAKVLAQFDDLEQVIVKEAWKPESLGTDDDDLAFVRSIISLADALDLHVVAEGVETPEQARILTDLGCHRVQGYLYAKPGPPEHLRQHLPV